MAYCLNGRLKKLNKTVIYILMFNCIALKFKVGPRSWLAEKCFKTPVVYFTDRKCSGHCVSLNLCCFVVYSTGRFVVYLTLCYFVLVFFFSRCSQY